MKGKIIKLTLTILLLGASFGVRAIEVPYSQVTTVDISIPNCQKHQLKCVAFNTDLFAYIKQISYNLICGVSLAGTTVVWGSAQPSPTIPVLVQQANNFSYTYTKICPDGLYVMAAVSHRDFKATVPQGFPIPDDDINSVIGVNWTCIEGNQ